MARIGQFLEYAVLGAGAMLVVNGCSPVENRPSGASPISISGNGSDSKNPIPQGYELMREGEDLVDQGLQPSDRPFYRIAFHFDRTKVGGNAVIQLCSHDIGIYRLTAREEVPNPGDILNRWKGYQFSDGCLQKENVIINFKPGDKETVWVGGSIDEASKSVVQQALETYRNQRRYRLALDQNYLLNAVFEGTQTRDPKINPIVPRKGEPADNFDPDPA